MKCNINPSDRNLGTKCWGRDCMRIAAVDAACPIRTAEGAFDAIASVSPAKGFHGPFLQGRFTCVIRRTSLLLQVMTYLEVFAWSSSPDLFSTQILFALEAYRARQWSSQSSRVESGNLCGCKQGQVRRVFQSDGPTVAVHRNDRDPTA